MGFWARGLSYAFQPTLYTPGIAICAGLLVLGLSMRERHMGAGAARALGLLRGANDTIRRKEEKEKAKKKKE